MPRVPVSIENLRKLLAREKSLPTHEEAYKDIEKLIKRAGIPEDIRWNYGKPDLPHPNDAIFNFADIGEFPHGYLQEFDQPITQGVSKTVRPTMFKQPMREQIDAAKRGAKEGNWAWYDLGPYHRFVDEEMDPADLEHAQRFLRLGVPLSQQTSVPAEILGSSYLNQLVRERGLSGLDSPEAVGGITQFGGGASPRDKIDRAHRMLSGEPLGDTAPKLRAYEQNRAGNLYPATIDSKMIDMVGGNPQWKPQQKGAMAGALKSLAAHTGTMPAQLQAMMWPEGEKTGVGAAEPLVAVINNLIYRSAIKQGIDPKKHAIDVLSGRESIPFRAKELGYAGGGLVSGLGYIGSALKRGKWKPPTDTELGRVGGKRMSNEVAHALSFLSDAEKKELEEILREQVGAANVSIRMPMNIAELVPESGEIMNQFKSKHSGGMYAPRHRADFEKRAFGYSEYANPSTRPKYGYLSYGDGESLAGDPFHLAHYGNAIARLKEKVHPRTTFTLGDSLEEFAFPEPKASPSIQAIPQHSMVDAPTLRESLLTRSLDHLLKGGLQYPEAQVHGKLTPKDVEVLLAPSGVATPYFNTLKSLWGEFGVPVEKGAHQYAGGGIVNRARGALGRLAEKMYASAYDPRYDEGVGLEAASGRLTDNEFALKAYLATQAPLGWQSAIMGARDMALPSSGRHILYSTVPGDKRSHAALKVANLPRGVAENELEGAPNMVSTGMLPKAFWKSDLSDVAAVEKMPISRRMLGEHAEFMRPIAERYDEAVSEGHDAMTAHMEDFELEQMLKRKGMGQLTEQPVLGGDIFTYKGHVRTHPQFGGFPPDDRIQSVLRPRERGGGFTLLDAGALDAKLLNDERRYLPAFREIIEHRINTLMQPETAEMFRYLPEGARFKEGGHMDRARKLAGGGVVRNWLKGVEGSGFDTLLKSLKMHRALRPAPPVGARLMGQEPATAEQLQRESAQIARQEAMRQWVDKNFANYALRQMGTPDDPMAAIDPEVARRWGEHVRKVPAADVLTHLGHEKPSIWEKHVNPMETISRYAEVAGKDENAIPKWLMNLIEQDAPRAWSAKQHEKMRANIGHRTDALESGNMHTREGVGVRRGKLLHEMDLTPGTTDANYLERYVEEKQRQKALHDDKYQRRFAPPIELYDIDHDTFRGGLSDELSGLLDWMAQAQDIPPERLSRVSVPQAWQAQKQWHEQLAKKKAEMLGDPWLGTKPYKEYPSGHKWVEFDPKHAQDELLTSHAGHPEPKNKALEEALKREGDLMGHCVGGYCDDVVSGNTRILSLRDAKGQPHVTVEVQPTSKKALLDYPQDVRTSFIESEHYAKDGNISRFPEFLREKYPELAEQRDEIIQIKGKGNKAPIKDYLPFVQDLVRSGKWGKVGDYANTGFKDWRQFYPNEHAGNFIDAKYGPLHKKWRQNFGPFDDAAWDVVRPRLDQMQHVSGDELEQMLKEAHSASPFKPKGYAEGGTVTKQEDNVDLAQNMDQWFRGAESYYELPVGMLRTMARVESGFDPKAVSEKGAIGVMQWMPESAKRPGFNIDGFEPGKDIRTDIFRAAEYMKRLHEQYGDWTKALAAYNWGMGNVNTYGPEKMPKQTKMYVDEIMNEVATNNEFAGIKEPPPKMEEAALEEPPLDDESMQEILKLFPDLMADEDGEPQALAYLSELMNDGGQHAVI